MADVNVQTFGFKEFEKALERNPNVVKKELGDFMSRAIARLKSGILNNPWRVGMKGGGSPVQFGNLRDTHATEIKVFEAKIFPTAGYAKYVHGKRPWLDFVKKDKEKEIRDLETKMLENIVKDLAK